MTVGKNGVLRRAFVMSVNSGQEAEYRRRHNPIWPEMERTLRSHGVLCYSIFLDPCSGSLFGYVEFESQEQWDAIASTEACKRWWAHMRELMPTNPDNSPVQRDLPEVFHIEAEPGGLEPDSAPRPTPEALPVR